MPLKFTPPFSNESMSIRCVRSVCVCMLWIWNEQHRANTHNRQTWMVFLTEPQNGVQWKEPRRSVEIRCYKWCVRFYANACCYGLEAPKSLCGTQISSDDGMDSQCTIWRCMCLPYRRQWQCLYQSSTISWKRNFKEECILQAQRMKASLKSPFLVLSDISI